MSNETLPIKGNILIVDDTPDNLRLLSTMLTKRGYKVRSVINGKMALDATRAMPPDLILLDIRMPDMDGYEVCQRLKADVTTNAIPVIFLSALDDMLDKVKAFSIGVVG
nr:response regulator [Candidatus Entotheonella palauensis]